MEKVAFKDSFEIMVLLGSVCKGEKVSGKEEGTLRSEVAASALLFILLRTDVSLLLMFIYSSVWYKKLPNVLAFITSQRICPSPYCCCCL